MAILWESQEVNTKTRWCFIPIKTELYLLPGNIQLTLEMEDKTNKQKTDQMNLQYQ